MSGNDQRRQRRAHERAAAATAQHGHRFLPFPAKRPGEQIEIAFVPGATINDPTAVQDMMRTTHDGLIGMLGQRRRSGIKWHREFGVKACLAWLDRVYGEDLGTPIDGDTSEAGQAELHSGVDQYRQFCRDYPYDCVLIVAMCEAVVA